LGVGRGNLTINFKGNINNMVTGFYSANYNTGQESFIAVTDFGPGDARRAFPSWDEPQYKTMFDLTVIAPKDHITLTNMDEVNRRLYSEELEEIKFRTSPPMSTHLIAIVVGKFDFIEKMTQDGNVLIRVFTPIDRKNEGMFALDFTDKLLSFYKYYFNISYPLPKLDIISIPEFPSSMETWGLVTFTESQILVNNQTSEEEKRIVAIVIAHGLAHQWFGNLVTLDSWNDLWLNEGIATFMENQAIDIMYPMWKIKKQFVYNDLQNALEFDALKTAHSIETKFDNPYEIRNSFDDITYQKAASILRMLNSWIGSKVLFDFEEFIFLSKLYLKYSAIIPISKIIHKFSLLMQSMRAGIRSFLEKYSYLSASTKDLWNSFETENDLDVVEMMETWTKQKGFPVITVMKNLIKFFFKFFLTILLIQIKETQEGEDRVLTLTQEKFSAYGKLEEEEKSQLWHIPIRVTNMFSPFKPSAQILMKSKQINLTVEGVLQYEWLKLNPSSFAFYRVNYPIEMLDRFVTSIEDKSMPPPDRLNILSDLFAVIQSGRISTDVGLKFLMTYMNEDDSAVWNLITRIMSKLEIILSDTDLEEKFWSYGRELFSKMYKKIGWDKKRKEDKAITKLRPQILSLLGLFKEKSVITGALRKFRNYNERNIEFSNDILNTIYKIVGANCDEETFEELFEMYRNSSLAEERNLIALALSSTNEKDRVLQVLDFSLSVSIIPILKPIEFIFIKFFFKDGVQHVDSSTIISRLGHSMLGRDKTWKFLQNNFEEFNRRFGSSSVGMNLMVKVRKF
jgi:puromycin-sensitive aminopeptidase